MTPVTSDGGISVFWATITECLEATIPYELSVLEDRCPELELAGPGHVSSAGHSYVPSNIHF